MEKILVDEIGPEMVLEVYNPSLGLHGILVIDNTVRGPGKGGIRMTPTVTVEEVAKLARVMTYKTALYSLPFGGAKAGIVVDPKTLTSRQKKKLIQAFSYAIKPLCPSLYIAGPDMGTGEREMGWFTQANGDWHSATGKPASFCMRFFGKPSEKCGIPHEFGSTGFGVAHATEVAAKHISLPMKRATVAIEGFGNVGSFTFRYLEQMGAKIVAVSDSQGTIYNQGGVKFKELAGIKRKTGRVVKYRPGKILSNDELFALPVDILVTSAVPNVIREDNFAKVRAKLIVEGSNIPIKEEAEKMLTSRRILVVPDFVANAGGVISSYSEYIGQNPVDMMEQVKDKIRENVMLVLRSAQKLSITPREAAVKIAKKKLK